MDDVESFTTDAQIVQNFVYGMQAYSVVWQINRRSITVVVILLL